MVPGIGLGTVPGTVFLSSWLSCPFAFQESKAHEKKPGRALPPSGDGGRDEPGLRWSPANSGRKKPSSRRRANHPRTEEKGGEGSVCFI